MKFHELWQITESCLLPLTVQPTSSLWHRQLACGLCVHVMPSRNLPVSKAAGFFVCFFPPPFSGLSGQARCINKTRLQHVENHLSYCPKRPKGIHATERSFLSPGAPSAGCTKELLGQPVRSPEHIASAWNVLPCLASRSLEAVLRSAQEFDLWNPH